MSAPRVSVLIPTYNCGRFLGEAIESVLAQTFRDYEIIVVDDGSTDDTAQVAARYPQVTYIRREHCGVSAARNAAIAAASGEISVFLDADDLWVPEKLEKQVAYLDENPDCMLVFTKAANFYQDAQTEQGVRQQELYNSSLERCVITCAIRSSVFEKYGVFRTDYPHGEDTQFMFRLSISGLSLDHCIPEVLYKRRIHDSNISLTHESSGPDRVMAIMADAIRQVKRGKQEKKNAGHT